MKNYLGGKNLLVRLHLYIFLGVYKDKIVREKTCKLLELLLNEESYHLFT